MTPRTRAVGSTGCFSGTGEFGMMKSERAKDLLSTLCRWATRLCADPGWQQARSDTMAV